MWDYTLPTPYDLNGDSILTSVDFGALKEFLRYEPQIRLIKQV